MKELSLHILDLTENSIKAGAKAININILESTFDDTFYIEIYDDGIGMDDEFLKVADNPFKTTRKTRSVGLGLSLFKAAALRCEGSFDLTSKKNKGTKVTAMFKHSHIDRAPLGNMGETVIAIINSPLDFELIYKHKYNNNEFTFNTVDIKKILDGVDLKDNKVLLWIRDYINENIKNIYNHK